MGRRRNHEGTIRVRYDGRVEGKVMIGGRMAYVYGRDEQEVADKLAALRQSYGLGIPESCTLGDLFGEYFASVTLKRSTRDLYLRQLPLIYGRLGKRTQLRRIQPATIQSLYNATQSQRGRLLLHQLLHRVFGLAVRRRMLAANPCDHVERPTYRARQRVVWGIDELRRFLAAAGRWRPLWLFLAGTGLRIGEARALTWADIDLDQSVVYVRANVVRVAGRDLPPLLDTPKGHRGRELTLPGVVIAALEAWREAVPSEGWVWLAEGGRLASYSTLYHAFVRDARRAQLRGQPHLLRHFHASILFGAIPLPEISRRLGHASPAITSSIYAHAIRPDERAAAVVEAALTEEE